MPSLMSIRHSLPAALAAAALTLCASEAGAQCPSTAIALTGNPSASVTLCMRVQDVLQMRTTSTLTAPATLTAAQFTASATPAGSSTYVPFGGKVNLEVAANRPFAVTVTGAFSGPGTKSASDALWSTTAGVFTNTARDVSAANAESNRTIPFAVTPAARAAWSQDVYFASRWVYETDRSGTYNLTLTFTLAAK
ncbi:hypothetical protein [Roseisolibacter agri]|uniref:Spore coat protein U domain-containing protein n=1 Tax=Roseisolibacter agri TaxID=2014610 RepID=A0AA37QHR1_9BACT|nr:hypothetical protein [Roseisolibacter agri]GLC27063.1 hypothetical protein rosag_35760 [Roseisolibacter agri]